MQRNFELPKETEKVLEILEKIPENYFEFVRGYLIAPKKLYDEKRIAENTRLKIGEVDSWYMPPGIEFAEDLPFEDQKKLNPPKEFVPNILGIFTEGKLVSSVDFHQTSGDTYIVDAKGFINRFIKLGYKGEMHLIYMKKDVNEIDISHVDNEIKLKSLYESRDDLEAVITQLEKLGLQELAKTKL